MDKSKTSNSSSKLFLAKIFSLAILVLGALVIIILGIYNISNNSSADLNFSDTYQANLKLASKAKLSDGRDVLENWLDPTSSKILSIKESKATNSLNVKVSASEYVQENSFLDAVNRRGYLYFLTSDGHDLLAESYDSSKTPNWSPKSQKTSINDALDSVSKTHNPTTNVPAVNITFKNNDKITKLFNNIQTWLNAEKSDKSIYVWSDIAAFLNICRSNYADFVRLADIIEEASTSSDPGQVSSLKQLLLLKNHDGVNLFDAYNNDNTTVQKWFDNNDVVYQNDLSTLEKGINPNTKTQMNDLYIKPWRQYLYKLALTPGTNDIQNRFKSFLLSKSSFTPAKSGKPNTFKISDLSQIDAIRIETLLNAGISGVSFTLTNYNKIAAVWNKSTLIGIAIAVAIIGALFVAFMLYYYRFYGAIGTLWTLAAIISAIVATSYLSVLIGPAILVMLLISASLAIIYHLVFLERFRREFKIGNALGRAFKNVNFKTLSTILDSVIVIFLIGLVCFWLGIWSTRAFSITGIIVIVTIFIFSIIGTRLTYWMMTYMKDKKLILHYSDLPWYLKFGKEFNFKPIFSKFNFKLKTKNTNGIKNISSPTNTKIGSKFGSLRKLSNFRVWLTVAFTILFVVVGAVVFGVVRPSLGDAYRTTANYNIVANGIDLTNSKYINQLRSDLKKEFGKSIYSVDIVINLNSSTSTDFNRSIQVETSFLNNNSQTKFNNWISEYRQDGSIAFQINGNVSVVKTSILSKLILQVFLEIIVSAIIIAIYIAIRFGWTYAIATFLAIAVVSLFVIAFATITRIPVDYGFMAALLGVIIFSAAELMILFDGIREKYNNLVKKLDSNKSSTKLDSKHLFKIVSDSWKEMLFQFVVSSICLFLFSFVILLASNSTMSFTLTLMFTSWSSFVVASVFAGLLWVKIHTWNHHRKITKKHRIKFNLNVPDEHVVTGINDW